MKILLITAEGFDTPNPNNQMTEVLIDFFLKNNYSVHLIQSNRSGCYDEIPFLLKNRNNFTFKSIYRKKTKKSNFISRYIYDTFFQFKTILSWIFLKDIDLVYVQSNPTVIYLMILLKLIKKWPIIYSVYDIFPGHAYDIGVIKSRIIYQILDNIQKICYKIPNKITVLSEDMKFTLSKKGINNNKIITIPAWVDNSKVFEVDYKENKFIEKYQLSKSKFYLQFAGTLGYVFDYQIIIELAKRFKHFNDIEFQMIGDGAIREKFANEVNENCIRNIKFYPWQPLEIISDVYSSGDICIIPLKKGVIYAGVPSKIPLLMLCKKVNIVIVERDSFFYNEVNNNKIGIAIDHNELDKLENIILKLKNDNNYLKAISENAYIYAYQKYSANNVMNSLIQVIEGLK